MDQWHRGADGPALAAPLSTFPLPAFAQVLGRRVRVGMSVAMALTMLACSGTASAQVFGPPGSSDHRGYEQVSPVDKNGQPVFVVEGAAFGPARADREGNKLVFFSFGSFAGVNTGLPMQYRSVRGPGGWTTEQFGPRPVGSPQSFLDLNNSLSQVSENLEVGVYGINDPLSPLDQDGLGHDLYVRNSDGEFELVTRDNTDAPQTGSAFATAAGVSANGEHVLFESEDRLVAPAGDQVAGPSLYDRSGPRNTLVNVDSGGALLHPCGAVLGGGWFTYNKNAVSADGTKVVMTAPSPDGGADASCSDPLQVYVRVNDEQTLHASASQRSTPDPAGTLPVTYRGATPSGSIVLFSTDEALTDDAPPSTGAIYTKLYAYNTETRDLKYIASNVSNLVGTSNDGTKVYFTGEPQGVPGEGSSANLYLWTGNQTRFIITGVSGLTSSTPAARVTPSGDYIGFEADPMGPNIYRYSAVDDQLDCATCAPDGTPATAAAYMASAGGTQPHNLSDDGRHLIFHTPQALLPQDSNGRKDVYDFTPDGLKLVSTGRGSADTLVVDMSRDGRDVFMATGNALLPTDTDNGDRDIYDARIGGGTSVPLPDAPLCQGDACQRPAPSPQAPADMATADVRGPGNPAELVRATATVSGISATSLRTFARRGSITLPVRVNKAGVLRFVATARIHGRRVTVARISRTASKAGTVTVRLVLSRAAVLELRARRKLAVTLTVTFSGQHKPLTRTLQLKAPQRSATANRLRGDR